MFMFRTTSCQGYQSITEQQQDSAPVGAVKTEFCSLSVVTLKSAELLLLYQHV
jgi:hypothetical protein